MGRKDAPHQEICDQLAAYELGLLENVERYAFETHLTDCDECLAEMFEHAPTAVAMTSDPGTYRQALVPERAGLWQALAERWPNAGPGQILAPLAIAATLALLLFWPGGNSRSKYGDLFILEPLAYTVPDMRSGPQDSALVAFDAGMRWYVAADYHGAANELARMTDLMSAPDAPALEPGVADQVRLYHGVSLLLATDPENAIPVLIAASASTLPPIQERSHWYLAQAYLLNNEPKKAEDVLSGLASSPIYGDQARELLAKLHAER